VATLTALETDYRSKVANLKDKVRDRDAKWHEKVRLAKQ